jgi:hypothetical protein
VPLAQAQLFTAPGGACIACLDRALTLCVLEAAPLLPVARVSLPTVMSPRWAGDAAAVFAAAADGHVFSVWRDSRGEVLPECCRLELLDEFSAPHPPPELRMWDRRRAAAAAEAACEPEKCDDDDDAAEEEEEPATGDAGDKRRAFFGKLGAVRVNVARRAANALKRVGAPGFKARKVLTADDVEALFPASQPPQRTTLVVHSPVVAAAAGRDELLGRPPGTLRSVDDIRERYGRPARPTDASSAMAENLTKLNERGERLNTIEQKTALLQSQAATFADSARLLREKQEASSFFGLFK